VSIVLVTGACGLIGSESVAHYAAQGYDVIGIDNGLRSTFFGEEASTDWMRETLKRRHPRYRHFSIDIRDRSEIERIFGSFGRDIVLIIHAAAQPSHDWAAQDPFTDFSINANGTLTLLDSTRKLCPEAVFIFTSTNKVYGDTPNRLPLVELDSRWEIESGHPAYPGMDETTSLDATTHSLFGVSKAAADLLVQEYGRYFGLKTGCFRGGCLTGPNHAGAVLHGFLSYLLKCAATGASYTIFGYKGKQVRDNIHSADLIAAFDAFFRHPRPGEIYNIGGGRECNCSVLEAIALCEELLSTRLKYTYVDIPRRADHMWYISNVDKFRSHYPGWRIRYGMKDLVGEIYERNLTRWSSTVGLG
jgi:CDP-paratose 2-epimerase